MILIFPASTETGTKHSQLNKNKAETHTTVWKNYSPVHRLKRMKLKPGLLRESCHHY